MARIGLKDFGSEDVDSTRILRFSATFLRLVVLAFPGGNKNKNAAARQQNFCIPFFWRKPAGKEISLNKMLQVMEQLMHRLMAESRFVLSGFDKNLF